MRLYSICENRCLCTCHQTTKTEESCCGDFLQVTSIHQYDINIDINDINACPYKYIHWVIHSTN